MWMDAWSVVWFVGLSVFSILSVLVIIFGGYDLAALLKSLAARHGEAQAAEAAETP
jgi:uncharacterized membrane protein SpoIIM required for sporulation